MFLCSACSNTTTKWQGKCPTCNEWGSLVEVPDERPSKRSVGTRVPNVTAPVGFVSQSSEAERGQGRSVFRSDELNTVLGGWLVRGSFVLLSGEPGIGKSTLSLQVADWIASPDFPVLYVSAEESVSQVSDRAHRLGAANASIRLVTTGEIESILAILKQEKFGLVVIDSVSLAYSSEIASSCGSITQIRAVAEMLLEYCKSSGTSVVLIGHVTKDGSISGPKVLEHLVDTVLFLEWTEGSSYRMLRVFKNRFGPTDETGLFSMTQQWLRDLKNPGLEFVENRSADVVGAAIGVTMEWTRPILCEIEALTVSTKFGYPKRSWRGIPNGKLDLLLAALSKYSRIRTDSSDVYVNVSRGLSLSDPGVDLATLAAIVSSRKRSSLGKAVFIGEVSLTGIVRSVPFLGKRIDEARKLGFAKIIVPKGASDYGKSKEGCLEIASIRELESLFVHNEDEDDDA